MLVIGRASVIIAQRHTYPGSPQKRRKKHVQ
jgi:hypothetical protein